MSTEDPSNVGLVTGDSVPDLTEERQAVERALGERGSDVSGVVLSDSDTDDALEGILLIRHEEAGER